MPTPTPTRTARRSALAGGPAVVAAVLAVLAVLAVVVLAVVATVVPPRLGPAPDAGPPERERVRVVGAWMPHWRQEAALASVRAYGDQVAQASPYWFELGPDGRTELPGVDDPAVVRAARDGGARLVPMVTNFGLGGAATTELLADAARRDRLAGELAALAADRGYDGLDVDFEQLPPAAREPMSAFVAALAERLHAADRVLVVSVPAKVAEPGRFEYTRAFDWAELGRHADVLRVMTYALSPTAEPGPVDALDFHEEVAAFAAATTDPSRVQLGVPLFGYDWPRPPGGGEPRSMTWVQSEEIRVAARAAGTGGEREWDPDSGAPFFRYTRDGVERTVWFMDAEAVCVRMAAVHRHRLAGVALWSVGDEDPAVWTSLRECGSP